MPFVLLYLSHTLHQNQSSCGFYLPFLSLLKNKRLHIDIGRSGMSANETNLHPMQVTVNRRKPL